MDMVARVVLVGRVCAHSNVQQVLIGDAPVLNIYGKVFTFIIALLILHRILLSTRLLFRVCPSYYPLLCNSHHFLVSNNMLCSNI